MSGTVPLDQVQQTFPPDLPLTFLRAPETLVITTLRTWMVHGVQPLEGKRTSCWQRGLEAASVARQGIHSFDTFLWILLAAGNARLDIRIPKHPSLCSDEGRILQLVNHSQLRMHSWTLSLLEGWLDMRAARTAVVHLNAFARALSEAGLAIQAPAGTIPANIVVATGSALIH